MSEFLYTEKGPVMYVSNPFNPDSYVTIPNYNEVAPEIVSFNDYLVWNYTDSYIGFTKGYIENGLVPLGYFLDDNRHLIDEIRLNSAEIHHISLHRLSMTSFRIDVIMIAGFTAKLNDKRYMQKKEWYRITGTLDTQGECNFFQSMDKYRKQDIPTENPLSEYLIPYLSKADLDSDAEAMLREFYPKALDEPSAVDAVMLAKNMGYKVKVARLSLDDTRLGAVYMRDSEVTHYKNEKEVHSRVAARTILIDTVACEHQNRNEYDVIVHECIHIYEHTLFYELQKTYRDHYSMELPGFEEIIEIGLGTEQLKWIESQATHMTPRVRMPLCQTSIKAAEFFEMYKNLSSDQALERVIDAVSAFFRHIEVSYR